MKARCPICDKELEFSEVEINKLGAVCSHKKFDVKIYIEAKEGEIL